ncbi:MAG: Leucine-, isoleucine-, valine-, threonine-, and alanine-binding protein [Candidatus Dichloromethanomonas elyunquensis]|nr:MAG: Leucine-, isoleucine-, valine-, threonine-, and alanine-binding protein [Candidatus Dichloromethanomonas elyunquensis]
MRAKTILTYAFVPLMCLALAAGCSPETSAPAAPAVPDVIKIGGNFELTGGVAEFGKKGENGAELAIKQTNAKGGVLGKQISYVGADNKSEAGESTVAAAKLATQDKVIGIIGPMTIGNTLAEVQVVTDNKVPVITPSGTSATITMTKEGKLNSWLFRACFIDPFQGEVAAAYAIDTLKASKAALVIDQKGNYAKGLADSFKTTFEKAGKQIVASEQYVAGQDTDFRAILTNIMAMNPDVVFVPGYYNEVGMIIKQARKMNLNVAFLGGDGWGIGPIVDIAGKEAMNNTFYVDVAIDKTQFDSFSAAYKAEYAQDPDGFAVLGYDAANMMIQAIQTAGSVDTEKIRQALENMKGFKGVSGEINVEPATHNPKKSASIYKFEAGQIVLATTVNLK